MSDKGELDLTGAKQNTGMWLVKVRTSGGSQGHCDPGSGPCPCPCPISRSTFGCPACSPFPPLFPIGCSAFSAGLLPGLLWPNPCLPLTHRPLGFRLLCPALRPPPDPLLCPCLVFPFPDLLLDFRLFCPGGPPVPSRSPPPPPRDQTLSFRLLCLALCPPVWILVFSD